MTKVITVKPDRTRATETKKTILTKTPALTKLLKEQQEKNMNTLKDKNFSKPIEVRPSESKQWQWGKSSNVKAAPKSPTKKVKLSTRVPTASQPKKLMDMIPQTTQKTGKKYKLPLDDDFPIEDVEYELKPVITKKAFEKDFLSSFEKEFESDF